MRGVDQGDVGNGFAVLCVTVSGGVYAKAQAGVKVDLGDPIEDGDQEG
ncbi:MAG: hypothetical protein IIB03_09920 [Acidobacteria bacterium]|nr:hypothetical protein [Acidobacteriota bacterium]